MNSPDFDTFLNEATQADALRIKEEAFVYKTRVFFQERIDTLGIPHLINIDPEQEKEAKEKAYLEYILIIKAADELNGSEDEHPQDAFTRASNEASWRVADQLRFEKGIEQVMLGAVLGCQIRACDGVVLPAGSLEAKKHAIADVLALADIPPSNPWVELMNDALQGEYIDLFSEEMQELVRQSSILALEIDANITDEHAEAYKHMEQLLLSRSALNMMAAHGVIDQIAHVASSYTNISEREPAIFEITRGIKLDEPSARELMSLMSVVYPLTSPANESLS